MEDDDDLNDGLKISFNKAQAEEKIMNTVFPIKPEYEKQIPLRKVDFVAEEILAIGYIRKGFNFECMECI
jgi:hypothetical protein